jgi:hypothetical protein
VTADDIAGTVENGDAPDTEVAVILLTESAHNIRRLVSFGRRAADGSDSGR